MSNVLTDATVDWNSTDYSSQVRSVTTSYEAEEVDVTAMGDNTRNNIGGLFTWNIEVEFHADETSGGNLADLFADVGTTQTLQVKPTSSAISASNPQYAGTALLTSIEPVSGTVGDNQVNNATFVSAGDLSRNTS